MTEEQNALALKLKHEETAKKVQAYLATLEPKHVMRHMFNELLADNVRVSYREDESGDVHISIPYLVIKAEELV